MNNKAKHVARDLWTKHRQKHQFARVYKTKSGKKRVVIDPSMPIPIRSSPANSPNKARCLCCGRNVASAGCDDSPWTCPRGAVTFYGGDNFGSAVYDSMVDGIRVKVIVCDKCLKARSKRILEWYTGTNDGQTNDNAEWWACGQSWPDEKSARMAWKNSSRRKA